LKEAGGKVDGVDRGGGDGLERGEERRIGRFILSLKDNPCICEITGLRDRRLGDELATSVGADLFRKTSNRNPVRFHVMSQ